MREVRLSETALNCLLLNYQKQSHYNQADERSLLRVNDGFRWHWNGKHKTLAHSHTKHTNFSSLCTSQCLRINSLLIYEHNNKKHTMGLRLIKLCIKAHFGTIKSSYLLILFLFCRLSFFWGNKKSAQAEPSKTFLIVSVEWRVEADFSSSLVVFDLFSAFSLTLHRSLSRDSWT